MMMSRPAWDAWIEIPFSARELPSPAGRVPHGTRGLKSRADCWTFGAPWSRPAWDAWIEIGIKEVRQNSDYVASRMGRVD